MAGLKGGVAADVVITGPDYVRFRHHYRSGRTSVTRGTQSKGIVEHLVGYAKRDDDMDRQAHPGPRNLARVIGQLCQPGARRTHLSQRQPNSA